MKKRKPEFRFLSILLVVVLCFTFSGSPSLANEATAKTFSEGNIWQPVQDEIAQQNTEGDLPLNVLATKELNYKDKPEVVSDSKIIENHHVNRLWAQESDLSTVIFQNRDGTKTMYYYSEPVKYVDKNGQVKDKRSNIAKLNDESDYAKEYGHVNADNNINTYFPRNMSKESGIVLEKGDIKIELAPLFCVGKNLKASVTEKSDLKSLVETAPTLRTDAQVSSSVKSVVTDNDGKAKDAIQYDKVFGEEISLRYTTTFSGYKEDIILNRYTGINEFAFTVKTNGLSLTSDDGCFYLVNPLTGDQVASIGDIFVYDSNLKESPEYNHHYRIETIEQDNEYILTVVVNERYLLDESTLYPVVIDPSVKINSFLGNTKNIMDAPIYSGRPSTVHGGNSYNVIGNVGYWNSAYHGVGRTLVKFPGLINNVAFQALSNSQITSVNFYMRENSGMSSPTANVDAYIFTGGNWTESTVKCNTFNWNSYTCKLDTENFANSSGKWGDFDITFVARAWKSGTYNWSTGIILKNQNEIDTGYWRSFSATEFGSALPYVTINYTRNFYATVNNYFDNGYSVRYNGTGTSSPTNVIASHQNWASNIFQSQFNLYITSNTPGIYTSTADSCKTRRGLTVNTTTIDQLCPGGTGHNPLCTNNDTMYGAFIGGCSGTDTRVSALWSGNRLESNRSFAWYSSGIFIIDLPSASVRVEDERFTLLHELAHQFGAPDHYCEDPYAPDNCGIELCWLHNTAAGRTSDCAMGMFVDNISSWNVNDIFCDPCKEAIVGHLAGHH